MSSLRSNRSASLPHTGVLTVSASSVDVTIQVYDDWLPPRSDTITGSAVDTTVLDRMVTNMPSSSPDMASRTWRWLMPAPARSTGATGAAGGSTTVLMRQLPGWRSPRAAARAG